MHGMQYAYLDPFCGTWRNEISFDDKTSIRAAPGLSLDGCHSRGFLSF